MKSKCNYIVLSKWFNRYMHVSIIGTVFFFFFFNYSRHSLLVFSVFNIFCINVMNLNNLSTIRNSITELRIRIRIRIKCFLQTEEALLLVCSLVIMAMKWISSVCHTHMLVCSPPFYTHLNNVFMTIWRWHTINISSYKVKKLPRVSAHHTFDLPGYHIWLPKMKICSMMIYDHHVWSMFPTFNEKKTWCQSKLMPLDKL